MPVYAGSKATERRVETAVSSPARDVPRPPPPPAASPAPRPGREPAPVLVLAGAGAEASLEGESSPDPRPPPEAPRRVRGESSFEPDRSTSVKPARPPLPASIPDPGSQRAPRRVATRSKDAFVPFSDSAIALLSLDPYRAVASWDARPPAVEAARRRVDDAGARLAVRFHEISLVDFDGSNANEIIEVVAPGPSGNYYLNVWSSGKCFVADLIVRAADGRFALLARSNFVELPRDGESARFEDRRRRVLGAGSPLWRPRAIPEAAGAVIEHVAEAALASEDEYLEEVGAASLPEARRFQAAGAEGPGAERPPASLDPLPAPAGAGEGMGETPPALEARIRLEAGGPSSWMHGLTGPGQPAPVGISSLERPAFHDQPHLEVKADLVIYGRTRPGTEVVIDGVQVPVREDGTFDLRFALPRVVEPESQPRAHPPGRPRRHSHDSARGGRGRDTPHDSARGRAAGGPLDRAPKGEP